MRQLMAAIGCAAAFLSASAYAGVDGANGRKIVDIGCHNVDGTCFVTLSGAAFGASMGCGGATNEFRFDNGDTAIGRRSYASLLAAYLAGKTISVYLDGCTGQNMPALRYFHIND
ncbi:MAG TPA: hypothetical protein VLA61_07090 [Ideonella sp.]|uniref:hypothetical protein n=1 Tax=Ideonella sp. TaxID=1929293 RepID=UPI002CDED382|nr:hypothetical protein [Ideonella sp.]HSI48017.1 hypothetical protein [Ideonella sp.]